MIFNFSKEGCFWRSFQRGNERRKKKRGYFLGPLPIKVESARGGGNDREMRLLIEKKRVLLLRGFSFKMGILLSWAKKCADRLLERGGGTPSRKKRMTGREEEEVLYSRKISELVFS